MIHYIFVHERRVCISNYLQVTEDAEVATEVDLNDGDDVNIDFFVQKKTRTQKNTKQQKPNSGRGRENV